MQAGARARGKVNAAAPLRTQLPHCDSHTLPALQNWRCAHVGALLWVVQLWGVANVAAHVDRMSFRRTAYQTWWLGFDPARVAAHERATSRSHPAWMMDFERLRLGDIVGSDGSPLNRRPGPSRMHYSPTGGLEFRHTECTVARRRMLLERLQDDEFAEAADGESARRVGMVAFMFLHEQNTAVMHGHAESTRAREVAAKEREDARQERARRG